MSFALFNKCLKVFHESCFSIESSCHSVGVMVLFICGFIFPMHTKLQHDATTHYSVTRTTYESFSQEGKGTIYMFGQKCENKTLRPKVS